MGFLSRFEGKMEDTVEGAAERMGGSSISPVQIAKKAEKQMRREKIVGAGKQYAPTLYTVLVSKEDDKRLFNYYPTLAGETETYLYGKAAELGLVMDGQPLVRFIADPELKRGKFDVVAEMVAQAIVTRLRNEEMARYGLGNAVGAAGGAGAAGVMDGAAGIASAVAGGAAAGAGVIGAAAANRSRRPSVNAKGRGTKKKSSAEDISYDFSDFSEPGDNAPIPGVLNQVRQIDTSQHAQIMADQLNAAPMGAPDIQDAEVYLYDEARDIAYVLTGQPQRIGRESVNDIVVPDINASRSHAEIHMEPTGAWVINDLNSTNGLFVNERQIKSVPLRDGDMIRIGTTELEFQLLT